MRKILFLILGLAFFLFTGFVGNEQIIEYGEKGLAFNLNTNYQIVDEEKRDIVLTLKDKDKTIRVFVEDLKEIPYDAYINYSNKQLYLGKANFRISNQGENIINDCKVKYFEFYRPEITTLENDQSCYYETHIIDQKQNQVITIWGKSTKECYWELKQDIALILHTWHPIEKVAVGREKITKFSSPHIKYQGKTIELDIPPQKMVWGRFFPEVPFNDTFYQQMLVSEKALNHKFEFIMSYKNFPTHQPFPKKEIERVYQDKRVFMLSLQPFTSDLNWIAIPEFVAGKHDAKIKEWAEGLRDIGEPVFVRPLNEMNGDWDPWCAWFYGKDTELFIQAWKHIVDIFREVKADNVYFVWNPHDRSFPDFQWNNPHLYYPGDDYVDWVGLTGYNNGTSYSNDIWREFDEIYIPIYTDYLLRYGDKPFMITEFSSNEVGGNKAQWILKGLNSLAQNYANIKIVTWFDGQDGPWQYQLNSSPEAFQAFKNILRHPNYLKDEAVRFIEE